MRKLCQLVATITLSCVAQVVAAQVAAGLPNFSAYDAHEVDAVNLQDNTVTLKVPVRTKPGAFPFSATLMATSFMGRIPGLPGTLSPSMVLGVGTNPGAPFVYIVDGRIGFNGTAGINGGANTQTTLSPCGGYPATQYSQYYVTTPDGTQHPLPPSDSAIQSYGSCTTSFTDTTIDGSGITATFSGISFVSAYFSDGQKFSTLPEELIDANGNNINIPSSLSGTFYDTMGLVAVTVNDSTPTQPTYSWSDINGGTQTLSQLVSAASNVRTNFGCSLTNDVNPGATSLPSGFSFPDGTSLAFTYEPTHGYSGNVTSRIQQITLREGGTVTFTYGGGNNGIDCNFMNPPTLTRTLGNGDVTSYTLTHVQIGSGTNYQAINTVIDPAETRAFTRSPDFGN
jgi:hypothetical protein